MKDIMKGDFYHTLITLILFDCILLLLVNLLRRRKKQIKIVESAPTPSPPKLVDLNQYIKSSAYENPTFINNNQTYENLSSKISSKISYKTCKSNCYLPIKDGEQPYAAYKMNYFS